VDRRFLLGYLFHGVKPLSAASPRTLLFLEIGWPELDVEFACSI